MSERYQRLFSLPEKLYADGAPVLIAAGALLKDTQTGAVLALMKFQNIGREPIRALTVRVTAFDTVGQEIGETREHHYLDLDAQRDGFFGQKEPVRLSSPLSRAFSAAVTEAVFADGAVWSDPAAQWQPLETPGKLADELGDPELVKQYRITYGTNCRSAFRNDRDLWFCPCGALNRQEDDPCHVCGKSRALLMALDLDELSADRDARLEQERLAREEEERRKAEKRALWLGRLHRVTHPVTAFVKKRWKPLLAAAAACVAAVLLITQLGIPYAKYRAAESLLEAGQYQEAVKGFQSLGSFLDSPDRIVEVRKQERYDKAAALRDEGNYSMAIRAFEALGDFSDSPQQVEAIKEQQKDDAYQEAVKLYRDGELDKAISAFTKLGDYKDSKKQLAQAEIDKKEGVYKQAKEALSAGDSRGAYELFQSIPGYRDVDALLKENEALAREAGYAPYKEKGAVLTFGSYEQDGDSSNGGEAIQWLVLDSREDSVLVISRYALANRDYHDTDTDVTWETCSLRAWLNDDFFPAAFTEGERAAVLTTEVDNGTDQRYASGGNAAGGNNTRDKVFLLSGQEAVSLLQDRTCSATDAARSGSFTYGLGEPHCYWWLRSPGEYQSWAECVLDTGGMDSRSVDFSMSRRHLSVRPALWLDLAVFTGLQTQTREAAQEETA